MKVSTPKEKSVVKASILGPQENSTMDSGQTVTKKGMASGKALKATNTSDSGTITSHTGSASIPGETVTFTKENGKHVCVMARAVISSQLEMSTSASTSGVKPRAMGSTPGRTGTCTLENSTTVRRTAKASGRRAATITRMNTKEVTKATRSTAMASSSGGTGSKYKGNYVNDVKQGYGEMYWSDGSIYRGYWEDGV
eukprot:CAMPEP_0170499990 /NCGR_PEP_ID=MMETSP0208-20121228/33341_1 /TAXON_ID=197538 /ORGANISM="Strombidium inclinatum, Strain S3" /LENGTH=196 /DNA_ID=CAMNT_0010777803 /DNA_START=521 /DNA_END=1110 /DNA_ORIENTATION=+